MNKHCLYSEEVVARYQRKVVLFCDRQVQIANGTEPTGLKEIHKYARD